MSRAGSRIEQTATGVFTALAIFSTFEVPVRCVLGVVAAALVGRNVLQVVRATRTVAGPIDYTPIRTDSRPAAEVLED